MKEDPNEKLKIIHGEPGLLLWKMDITIFRIIEGLSDSYKNLLENGIKKSDVLAEATRERVWSCIGKYGMEIYFVRGSPKLVEVFLAAISEIDGDRGPSLEPLPEIEDEFTPDGGEYYRGEISDAIIDSRRDSLDFEPRITME